MKSLVPFLALACLLIVPLLPAAASNQLTKEEKKAGWRLLFDGQTTQGWRSYKTPSFPSTGWVVEEGWLKKIGGVRGGDIMTIDTFTDFELSWEWIISPKGNNGVKYFITKERNATIGHEYQMLDDGDRINKGSTASFYVVLPPEGKKLTKPAGQINHSRIVVKGQRVEHWLNGVRVLEYELGSSKVLENVAKSKFKNVKGFGTKVEGHILLTDHGSECRFRNIKIRE